LRALLPAAALVAMSVRSPALPQSGSSKPVKESRRDSEILLMERNRNLLHLGDPLTIVGIDQGGKEFRSETPVLLQSDRAHVQVDQEDLRRRELAIYERGDLFSTPTAPAPQAAPTQDDSPPAPPAQEPARGIRGVAWFTGIGSVLALSGLLVGLGIVGTRKRHVSTRSPARDVHGPILVQARVRQAPEATARDVDSPTGIRSTQPSAASTPKSSHVHRAR
jgi:hypothetical protein